MAAIGGAKQASYLGFVMATGALMSLVIPLLVGPLSDRCTSRFGRRRPFILAGTIINVLGLVVMFKAGEALSLA